MCMRLFIHLVAFIVLVYISVVVNIANVRLYMGNVMFTRSALLGL